MKLKKKVIYNSRRGLGRMGGVSVSIGICRSGSLKSDDPGAGSFGDFGVKVRKTVVVGIAGSDVRIYDV